jgi:hypothetical protein
VLGRIVRDEAAHGTFGFTFLEWARPQLTGEELAYLGGRADGAIRAIHRQWDILKKSRSGMYDDVAGNALAWMQSDAYLKLAAKSLEERVRRPLRAKGIPLTM